MRGAAYDYGDSIDGDAGQPYACALGGYKNQKIAKSCHKER